MVSPRFSPLPRSPSASALMVALRLIGSIFLSTSVSVWKSVLTSSCTSDASTRAPGFKGLLDGLSGGRNSTAFAPNTVVPPMRTCALSGMYDSWLLSMARVS